MLNVNVVLILVVPGNVDGGPAPEQRSTDDGTTAPTRHTILGHRQHLHSLVLTHTHKLCRIYHSILQLALSNTLD
ncbi:hypothetical protein B5X24_HaOG215247 [Helicoverpa armigera]|nr:hypothetical protein B5X24_HaOG215247 [Helicoverpa armigera]